MAMKLQAGGARWKSSFLPVRAVYKPEDDPQWVETCSFINCIQLNFTSYCCVRRTINNIVILAQWDGTPTI